MQQDREELLSLKDETFLSDLEKMNAPEFKNFAPHITEFVGIGGQIYTGDPYQEITVTTDYANFSSTNTLIGPVTETFHNIEVGMIKRSRRIFRHAFVLKKTNEWLRLNRASISSWNSRIMKELNRLWDRSVMTGETLIPDPETGRHVKLSEGLMGLAKKVLPYPGFDPTTVETEEYVNLLIEHIEEIEDRDGRGGDYRILLPVTWKRKLKNIYGVSPVEYASKNLRVTSARSISWIESISMKSLGLKNPVIVRGDNLREFGGIPPMVLEVEMGSRILNPAQIVFGCDTRDFMADTEDTVTELLLNDISSAKSTTSTTRKAA